MCLLYAELMSQKNTAAEHRAESNKAEMKHGSEGAMKSLNSETSGEGNFGYVCTFAEVQVLH